MNRRQFLALSGAASVAAVSAPAKAAEAAANTDCQYYELRQLILDKEDQKSGVDVFLKDAAIPALNRLGIKPVGVFYPSQGFSPVYV